MKAGDSFVVDFPKFAGDPASLPRADVLSVEICADGSIIYESGGLTSVELPVNDVPYCRKCGGPHWVGQCALVRIDA